MKSRICNVRQKYELWKYGSLIQDTRDGIWGKMKYVRLEFEQRFEWRTRTKDICIYIHIRYSIRNVINHKRHFSRNMDFLSSNLQSDQFHWMTEQFLWNDKHESTKLDGQRSCERDKRRKTATSQGIVSSGTKRPLSPLRAIGRIFISSTATEEAPRRKTSSAESAGTKEWTENGKRIKRRGDNK